MRYITIQKLSEDVGIEVSSIRNLIEKGVLKSHSIDGFERIFIDKDEFEAKIQQNNDDEEAAFDLDRYMVS